eukprot:COSAG02_NODE_10707_length_1877_cov_2.213161_2_plen_415_part_01
MRDITLRRHGQWGCSAAFENASAELASLGVPVYVRQTHSREEGAWWPTKTTPKKGWAQLVQDTGRNLPAEFLAASEAAGIRVIFYHYMMGNSYWANARPEWTARWPNGSLIITTQAPSGVMSTCAQPWREIFIAQIKELIAMGARAFYFDHYPGNPGGDWSESCRTEFAQRYGKPMPTGLTTINGPHKDSAYSSSRQVLEFNSQMTQEYFAELISAIEATANPDPVAALVSIATVPKLDNGQTELPTLYETSRLLSLGTGSEVCKSEYDIAGRTVNGPGGDPVDVDILMSFGWSLARDGTADAAPPHMWAPQLFTTNARWLNGGSWALRCCAAGGRSRWWRFAPGSGISPRLYSRRDGDTLVTAKRRHTILLPHGCRSWSLTCACPCVAVFGGLLTRSTPDCGAAEKLDPEQTNH